MIFIIDYQKVNSSYASSYLGINYLKSVGFPTRISSAFSIKNCVSSFQINPACIL